MEHTFCFLGGADPLNGLLRHDSEFPSHEEETFEIDWNMLPGTLQKGISNLSAQLGKNVRFEVVFQDYPNQAEQGSDFADTVSPSSEDESESESDSEYDANIAAMDSSPYASSQPISSVDVEESDNEDDNNEEDYDHNERHDIHSHEGHDPYDNSSHGSDVQQECCDGSCNELPWVDMNVPNGKKLSTPLFSIGEEVVCRGKKMIKIFPPCGICSNNILGEKSRNGDNICDHYKECGVFGNGNVQVDGARKVPCGLKVYSNRHVDGLKGTDAELRMLVRNSPSMAALKKHFKRIQLGFGSFDTIATCCPDCDMPTEHTPKDRHVCAIWCPHCEYFIDAKNAHRHMKSQHDLERVVAEKRTRNYQDAPKKRGRVSATAGPSKRAKTSPSVSSTLPRSASAISLANTLSTDSSD